MKRAPSINLLWIPALVTWALSIPAQAALSIANGGFETGLAGWTTADQLGSEGTFHVQTGSLSPVNSAVVQPPPEGAFAAMSDAMGPGSHVLYQDFVVPTSVPATTLAFSLFLNNPIGLYFTESHLDFATPALNQQARVDIMSATSDPFSTTPGDVLQNLYQSMPGDPDVSGYTSYSFDLTSLLQANAGQTLRLRFAEVDNVFILNMGVDNVRFESAAVPEGGASGVMLLLALLSIGAVARLIPAGDCRLS